MSLQGALPFPHQRPWVVKENAFSWEIGVDMDREKGCIHVLRQIIYFLLDACGTLPELLFLCKEVFTSSFLQNLSSTETVGKLSIYWWINVCLPSLEFKLFSGISYPWHFLKTFPVLQRIFYFSKEFITMWDTRPHIDWLLFVLIP